MVSTPTGSLVSMDVGLQASMEDACIYSNGKVTIVIFVDDLLMLSRPEDTQSRQQIVQRLQKKVKLTGSDPAQWFLKIRITRDRYHRLLWLSMADYIDKMAAKYGITSADMKATKIPMKTRDVDDRKSSQGYVMKLFGGPIMRKSGRQDTVTTPSIDVEHLAISSIVKKYIGIE